MSREPSTVVITGGNRGIGLGFATHYAEAGWRVIATCRDPAAAASLRRLRSRHPGAVQIRALDVADHAQIEGLAGHLDGTGVDLLINNAGWGDRRAELADVTYESWERAMRVNAFATLKMAQVLVDRVARSAGRTIVTLSSQMGSIGENDSGTRYAYRASKAAANMIVKTLAVDLAPRGIIVVSLHPGWVKTSLGGPGALLSVEDSVRAMATVIDGLTAGDSGQFLDHRGRRIPW